MTKAPGTAAIAALILMLALALPGAAQNQETAPQTAAPPAQTDPAAPTAAPADSGSGTGTETRSDTAAANTPDAPTISPSETPAPVLPPVSDVPLATQALDLGTGLGHDLAGITREQITALVRELSRLSSADALAGTIWQALAAAELASLVTSIVVTVGTSLLLSAALTHWRRRPVGRKGTLARLQGTAIATALRLVALGGAWAVGLGVASWMSALTGQLFVLQTLYLSAFALFGLARAALAIVASPEAETGRSLSWVAPGLQRAIYRNAILPLGIVIQGMMFVAPGLREIAGLAVLRPMRVLVATLALLAALWGITRVVRAAKALRATDLVPDPAAPPTGGTRRASILLTRTPGLWAWPASLAALHAWLVTITMPALAGQIVLSALGGTVAALILVAAGLRLWGESGLDDMAGTDLPPPIQDDYAPLKQAGAALGAGLLLALAAVALLAGWGLIDPLALATSAAVQAGFWRLVSAGLVLAGAGALWLALSALFDRWLATALPGRREYNRRRTLLRLFRNAFGFAVIVIALMLALAQLGLDVAPLLAGAGVVGIAVGFGAQKLVQDIITGIFIQIENAVNEGDVVEVAGLSGGVERVSIRSIRLRALDGTLHVVPFSAVTTVSNMTRDFSAHVAEFPIAGEVPVAAVAEAMRSAFAQLEASDLGAELRGDIDLQGITAMAEGVYTFRALLRTAPAAQWAVGRRFTQLARIELAQRNIDSPPAPRRMLFTSPSDA
ncbi:hypothetical protein CKO11_13825 [Rhodobacter sp. TJ_12]|uniref:mechanosensitive ion channel family protein n=1 Tax=Rhodobacter sp. TJ_12 TaxID=2029399 RepID=UPI001CBB9099|nr:mechanosensitive ion channel domain-containing protein [Rhodobacter sp. TJ_12]MBZ4023536.1 hypothetical protein [Rhodobacter sp. TJ_12]